jgi:hypothetical protein
MRDVRMKECKHFGRVGKTENRLFDTFEHLARMMQRAIVKMIGSQRNHTKNIKEQIF